jgi:DNA-binding beta-propeller fold protein YncE
MISYPSHTEPRPASKRRGWRIGILAFITVFAADMSAITAQTGKIGFVLQGMSGDDYDDPEALVVSARGTHLYVADVDHDVIRVLQPFTLQTISVISHRSLKDPRGVAIGDDLRLYVADTGNNRIVAYNVQHDLATPVRTYEKDLNSPTGVARYRGRLYVVNESDDSIIVHEQDGTAQKIQKSGNGPGAFNKPRDILVAPEGHIIVSDSGNNRIQILGQTLEPLKILQGKPYDFNEPGHMALDEAGNLFIADTGNDRILILDPDFNLVGQIGSGKGGSSKGRLDKPRGVAARSGYVWVADTGNDRILVYKYVLRP